MAHTMQKLLNSLSYLSVFIAGLVAGLVLAQLGQAAQYHNNAWFLKLPPYVHYGAFLMCILLAGLFAWLRNSHQNRPREMIQQ